MLNRVGAALLKWVTPIKDPRMQAGPVSSSHSTDSSTNRQTDQRAQLHLVPKTEEKTDTPSEHSEHLAHSDEQTEQLDQPEQDSADPHPATESTPTELKAAPTEIQKNLQSSTPVLLHLVQMIQKTGNQIRGKRQAIASYRKNKSQKKGSVFDNNF